jgi:asparagine synthase (glutamine-hydrolysing)
MYYSRGANPKFGIVAEEFDKIRHRGPDNTTLKKISLSDEQCIYIGFHRLSIMDTSENGDQPFESGDTTVICNGEIYNYLELQSDYLNDSGYTFKSKSDCEVILPIYHKYGINGVCNLLRGEYACIIYDNTKKEIFAVADFLRTRPLFIGYGDNGELALGSEVKCIQNLPGINEVKPFPPGVYWSSCSPRDFIQYHSFKKIVVNPNIDYQTAVRQVRHLLNKAVIKRLNTDQPIGYFLSGGLDSSLCASIGQHNTVTPIKTFTASFTKDGPDLLAARLVADYIKSEHYEYIFSIEDGIKAVNRVIKILETYCCTTIRASVPQLLLCEAIKRDHPEIKVMISGENSDEIFCGYEYFKYAPNAEESRKESIRREEQVFMYDGLRPDRTVASVSMELRVPFTDQELVDYVMTLNPEYTRAPTKQEIVEGKVEKQLLREAYESGMLPDKILYRSKMGLSDSCGLGWVDHLKKYAETIVGDDLFNERLNKFPDDPPRTKEEYWYRSIFELYYPSQTCLIKSHWMPQQEWFDEVIIDPSARAIGTFKVTKIE